MASHDGIGLRPAEGILSESEVARLVTCVRSFDGLVGERRRPDGTLSPYGANISLFAAFRGTVAGPDDHRPSLFGLARDHVGFGWRAHLCNSVLARPITSRAWQNGAKPYDKPTKVVLTEIEARLGQNLTRLSAC